MKLHATKIYGCTIFVQYAKPRPLPLNLQQPKQPKSNLSQHNLGGRSHMGYRNNGGGENRNRQMFGKHRREDNVG